MNPQVPVPYLAPLPPLIPWWEWVLVGLAITSVVIYTASLTSAWWPTRNRTEKNRRFSGIWGWTMPAMLALVLGLAFIDTKWKDHRQDLEYERLDRSYELSAPVIEALEDAHDLTIDSESLRIVEDSSADWDLVQVTLPDGASAFCEINVTTIDGQRYAQLDPESCTK